MADDELSQVVEQYTGDAEADVTDTVTDAPEVSSAETEGEAGTSGTLSRAEVEAMLQARDAEWQKRLQSSVDKAESRVTKRFTELQARNQGVIDALKQMGIPDAEIAKQAERLQTQAMQQALSEEKGSNPQQAQGNNPQAQGRDVNAEARSYLQAQGVTFEKDAPELQMIVTDGTPEEYLGSIKAAAKAYKARQQNKPQPPAQRSPTVGAVSGGKANKDLSKLSTRDLMSMVK